MRNRRIFVDLPLAEDETYCLAAQTAQRFSHVLRLKPGHSLTLFNGTGGEYQAKLLELDRRQVKVQTGSFRDVCREAPVQVHLGHGLARGERMDYAVQKAVELGVAGITPILTERSVIKLSGERLEQRLSHWQGVVVSACEQCGRNRIPEVKPPLALDAWLETAGQQSLKVVLSPGAGQGFSDIERRHDSVALLIGPEGGLSDAELAVARASEFVAISLGPRTLRTETAVVAALSALQSRWGDL